MQTDTATDIDLIAVVSAPEKLPQIVEAQRDAETTASVYSGYSVATNDDWESAAEDLKIVKRKIDQLAALETHIMGPLKEHAARLKQLFATPRERLSAAKIAIEKPMSDYMERVRRERAAAEAAALEAARARQAEEQAAARKAAAEAAERVAAAAAAAAELAKRAGAESAEAQAAARALQDAEDAEQSAAEAEHAAQDRPLVVDLELPEIPKAQGTSTRTRWTGKPAGGDSQEAVAVALATLVRAAATDASLLAYLSINQVAINQAATAMKSHARIPGFVFSPSTSIASARR